MMKKMLIFVKAIIFIDLKKKYDIVAYNFLFNKLEKMNIRPKLIRVLKVLYSSPKISVNIYDNGINVNRGYKEVYYHLSYSIYI